MIHFLGPLIDKRHNDGNLMSFLKCESKFSDKYLLIPSQYSIMCCSLATLLPFGGDTCDGL